jgi:hypothetical protein
LFQEQGSTGTIQAAGAITVKTVPFCRHPRAGVLVNPDQGKHQSPRSQGIGKPQSITTAMSGLLGRPLRRVKGQPHDEYPHPPLTDQGGNGLRVDFEILTMQWSQGSNRDAKGVTARQADAAMAHINGKGRTRLGRSHLQNSARAHGGRQGAATWLERFQHGLQPPGGFPGGRGGLAAPKTSSHQYLLPVAGCPQLFKPEVAHPIAELDLQPEGLAGPTQAVQQQGGWRTKQGFPTWHHREFNQLPTLRLISQPTDPGHRLTANGIHDHPAPGAAVIQQILTAAIEDLTKLGRDGCLFEMPELGGGMSIQGQ